MRRLRGVRAGATAVLGTLFGMLGAAGLVGVASVVLAPPACACSCAPVSDDDAFAAADVVFEGRLVQTPTTPSGTWSSDQQEEYAFTVTRVYKGVAASSQVVESALSGGSCGIELPRNSAAVVFAQADEAGRLTSGLCSGSRIGTALAAWGAGTAPAAAAAPSAPADASPSSTVASGRPASDEPSTNAGVRVLLGVLGVVTGVLALWRWRARSAVNDQVRQEARSTVGP